jgi:apolipoprotein N-acyltransferase
METPDVIVWPETATPFYFLRAGTTELTGKIEEGIKAADAFFIIGSPAKEELENGFRYYNSAYLMTPNGTASGRYDKQHLVPFGEYVPWQKLLWFVDKIVPGLVSFSSGPSGKVISWEHGGIGIQICYEVIFPSLSRQATQNGAHLLVNITNDAWFGKSSAPHQHLSMATFRAVENRRSVARSANTGISGFVDPTGRIVDQTPLFEEAVLTRVVPLLKEKTIYTRWGDWFPIVCGIWIAYCLYIQIVKTRPKKKKG